MFNLNAEKNKLIRSLGGSTLRELVTGEHELATQQFRKQSELEKAELVDLVSQPKRGERHRKQVIGERLGVLEVLQRILPENPAKGALISDIRRFFAEAHMPLDLRGDPPLILPLDEPLLQEQVIDPLLLRLQSGYPEVAYELINAYHALVQGADTNSVFGDAYKALEKLARQLSGQESLLLSSK